MATDSLSAGVFGLGGSTGPLIMVEGTDGPAQHGRDIRGVFLVHGASLHGLPRTLARGWQRRSADLVRVSVMGVHADICRLCLWER